jgi:hypothetical protein
MSTIFSRTLGKHFLLAPEEKFNYTEKRRLLLDKRIEVIDYDSSNNHRGVTEFIELLSQAVKTANAKQKTSAKRGINVAILSYYNDVEKYITRIETFFDQYNDLRLKSWSDLQSIFILDGPGNVIDFINTTDDERIDVVILLVTEESLKSKKFQKEIDLLLLRELDDQVRVAPLIIGDFSLPAKLASKTYLRVAENFTVEELKGILTYIL